MLKLVRKLLPWLTPLPNLLLNHTIDAVRFIRFNTNNDYRKSYHKHRASLIRSAHGLEKAFSLPSVKNQFGINLAQVLVDDALSFVALYGYDKYLKVASDVIKVYLEHHSKNMDSDYELLRHQHKLLIEKIGGNAQDNKTLGGTIFSPKQSYVSHDLFRSFFISRHSVRKYRPDIIDDKVVKDVINTSLNSPSSCNRHPWLVRIYQGKEKVEEVLRYQIGNRGFGDQVTNLFLVTGRLSYYSSKEHHQVYVDGGMFSMSLILALHSHGLQSCALNTAYHWYDERRLRKCVGLDADEVPIMMIAFGHAGDDARCAISTRSDFENIIHLH